MKTFNHVRFNGTLRDYQQTVYDNALEHLSDNKIHIVAAPGSGKTVLGLELIQKLDEPALILSPTVTIRQQWGSRFEEHFLPESEEVNEYVSYDLHAPKLITCITYQALHAAWNQLRDEETDELENVSNDAVLEFKGFDLLSVVKKAGIKTICLDEAHHLRSVWHKSLVSFINKMSDIKVISLTATPPYDSTPSEWKRYTDLCGEIDEEIFVPQLVAQNTLCPHQDYIFFNYPTKEEIAAIQEYRIRATQMSQTIIDGDIFEHIISDCSLLTDYQQNAELILDYVKEFIAILSMVQYRGINTPKKLIKLVSPNGKLPLFSLNYAQIVFEFVLSHPEIFCEQTIKELKTVLTDNGLIDKNRVCLVFNDKINRKLVSSIGKLKGITEIALHEHDQLGRQLRMLILTDYIRKDMVKWISTDKTLNLMGAVPIFEAVRRIMKETVGLAVLSGSLVIVPDTALISIKISAASRGVHYTTKTIPNTDYSELTFAGSNKDKVSIITEVFEAGEIQILIGTKSLLGEGWDSPCINSLILASFVGSYMLSNQMRGRAIRIDHNVPNKTANIWHLVTVEPPIVFEEDILQKLWAKAFTDKKKVISHDYETLIRRFDCFLSPAYQKNTIESGIDRIDIIKPPYDRQGIENINKRMLQIAADRDGMAEKWLGEFSEDMRPQVYNINEAPKTIQPKGFLFINAITVLLLLIVFIVVSRSIVFAPIGEGIPAQCLGITSVFILLYGLVKGFNRILRYLSPRKTIETLTKSLLKALKETGVIKSEGAMVKVVSDPMGQYIYSFLIYGTNREKNVFTEAVKELLSYIDNPRYVLVKKHRILFWSIKDYIHCYACPSIIGMNKERVKVLVKYMKASSGKFEKIYTRSEAGRKELLKCRKYSYINNNEIAIKGKKVVKTKWE